MSADANSANLDQHHFEWEIFARHMAELRQRMEAAAPRDPRIESGIPPHDHLEEEAFVRLTGLTRPGSTGKDPQPEAAQGAPEAQNPQDAAPTQHAAAHHATPQHNDDRISFSEPGVLDVDHHPEEDSFDAQVEQVFPRHTPDPDHSPEQSGIQNTDDDDADGNEENDAPPPPHSKSIAALRALVEDLEKDAPHGTDATTKPHPKRPLPLNTTLEELEDLLQALEDQPRDGEE